jgi:hypothetical protein
LSTDVSSNVSTQLCVSKCFIFEPKDLQTADISHHANTVLSKLSMTLNNRPTMRNN